MVERIEGIIIDTVKHSDKHNVVTLFTESRGRVAFLSPVGSGAKGRQRQARLMPLSVVQAEVNFRPNRELQLLTAVAPAHVWRNLYFDPVKSSLVLFLAEFLNKYMRTAVGDTPLYRYTIASLHRLDSMTCGIANFHIAFLIGFLHYAGIAPRIDTYRPGYLFNMAEGRFVASAGLDARACLPQDQSALIPLLARMHWRNLHLYRFHRSQRTALLDILLRYYSLHLPGLSNLKSLDILTSLFD